MSLWAQQESTRAVATQELFLPFLKIVFASALNFTGGFLGGGPFILAKKSLGARAERSIESVVLACGGSGMEGHDKFQSNICPAMPKKKSQGMCESQIRMCGMSHMV